MLQQRPDIKLLVAGEFYESAAPYHALIQELNLQDRLVLHTDFIPNAAVRHYFCAADLVVQPYRHATQSGVTQVAYHFNKPMVVTNVGGLPELVPDGEVGYVVEPQPQAIANTIIRFYTSRKGEAFAKNIEGYKKRFSWTSFVQSIWEMAAKL